MAYRPYFDHTYLIIEFFLPEQPQNQESGTLS